MHIGREIESCKMSESEVLLQVGLCDDEPSTLQLIEDKLREEIGRILPNAKLMIWAFQDGGSLLEKCCEISFDIVFLDIEMPKWDGFSLAKRLHVLNPETHLVFVSSYESRVFDAYEYTHLWFVRKSTLKKDISRALQKYLCLTANWWTRYKIEDGFGARDVLIKDIVYFECNCHDVMVKTIKDIFHTYGSLAQVEGKLHNHGFIRVHRNYLVNADYIDVVGIKEVELIDGTKVAMGKDRKKSVREELLKHARQRQ